MGSLLDEQTTWAELGQRNLDRRVTKAITKTLGLERPTVVQSRGIPVALEGKDLLCRARTGSGKTLCYSVPLVQRLLKETEAGGDGCRAPMRGLVLVPTKELCAQVHSVVTALLSFCFDVLTAETLLSNQKYLKAELPTILITTPSSAISLLKEKKGVMRPLSETLRCLVVDEADLMFSFGYEDDMRALCALLPPKYQAVLVSATLSEEVQQLRGLMLHKPVVLKLEEPRTQGKLSQFFLRCRIDDRYLILYTLLKLQLVQGKTLIFVSSSEAAYRLKILFERFSMNSAVLHAELPHSSRQNIMQAFNQGVVELLIATDSGLDQSIDASDVEEAEEDEEAQSDEEAEDDGAEDEEDGAEEGEEEEEEAGEESEEDEEMEKQAEAAADAQAAAAAVAAGKTMERARKRRKANATEADAQYSLTRGVDLKGVATVINADMPTSVRSYVHRVGRTARAGNSGTALTLCVTDNAGEEELLMQIVGHQGKDPTSSEDALRPLPLRMADVERFRYRVEDIARGLTRKSVQAYRARELQLEALNSEKLKAYFEDHPEDRKALQRTQRQLRERKSVRKHLAHVPDYLVPEQFIAATAVERAAREATGGGTNVAQKRKRFRMRQERDDPLRAFEAKGKGSAKKRRLERFTREAMEAKEKRINPKTANVEELPPLSGRKLWKLRHRKEVRKASDLLVERRRLTRGQIKRKKKFAAS